MSKELLQKVIDKGVEGYLNEFFLDVSKYYTELEDDLSEYDGDGFSDFQTIGEINFSPSEKLVVITANIAGDLTERSGKKAQYDKAKKILKAYMRYDAGIFVFSDTAGNFRLSLVYGTPDVTRLVWSNFRRFTYFVSPSQTNKTFLDRVGSCSFSSLEAIKDAFSVEKVNKEFYNHIARFFYRLTGYNHVREMKLPSVLDEDKKTYQEFAVRLIGRAIFCWFLKHKKSAKGIPLIAKEALSVAAVQNHSNYYHSILEPLFFGLMNTPIKDRKSVTIPAAEKVPFLNGGLFEPHENDFYKLSLINVLKIPDRWFADFFTVLEQYNFTIDENSTVDADVSVDPEMLGRIFENLLAEVNPDTGETARKATGSYYTPRTIVDYMVDQSLKQYLLTKTKIDEDRITALLSYEDEEVSLTEKEKDSIISSFDEIKIIDPACGSGAFPMGILHKMLLVLNKVDPDLRIWVDKRLERIPDDIFKKEIKYKLERDNLEYVRKLIIIRNSIFGVDIQQIAVEISKLRVFLSLIVDEKIDDEEENRGIKPLPNLEFKFVAANSLLGLPKPELDRKALIDFEDKESIEALARIRDNYFTSYGEDKLKAEQEFIEVQRKMFQFYLQNLNQEQRNLVGTVKKVNTIGKTVTQMLSEWEPFSNKQCEWFDPKWMFGKDNFDIVIANPAYLSAWTMDKRDPEERERLVKEYISFEVLKGHWDMYVAFFLRGYRILCEGGALSYILPNPVLREKYAFHLRKFLLDNMTICSVLSFAESNVFENVSRKTVVLVLNKTVSDKYVIESYKNSSWEENKSIIEFDATIQKHSWVKNNLCRFNLEINDFQDKLLNRIGELSIQIGNICYVNYGAQVSSKKKGGFKKGEVVSYMKCGNAKKFYEGKDLHRWSIGWRGLWLDYRKDELYGPRTEALFEKPKIAVRKVSDKFHRIGGALDLSGMYCDDGIVLISPHSTIEKTELNKDFAGYERIDADISLEYLTAFLLSSLSSFYYRNKFATESLQQATSHVYPQAVRAMPIKNISSELQRPFINMVNNILNITKDSDYLSTTSKQVEVKKLERQIDQMVYELYGLTPEEIAVVEGEKS